MSVDKIQVAVIVSRWNELITKALTEGALDELKRAGVQAEVYHVPGTWEVPLAAKLLLQSDNKPDGIVALGCIMQGQTLHAQLLSKDVSSALMGLQTEYSTPIGWGILTPDTQDQALERAGLKLGNKGREAALAVLDMVRIKRELTS